MPPKWDKREKVNMHPTYWTVEFGRQIKNWKAQERHVVKAAVDKSGGVPTVEYMAWYNIIGDDGEEDDERRTKKKSDHFQALALQEESRWNLRSRTDGNADKEHDVRGTSVLSWPIKALRWRK
ncbi:hypothetical protein AMTR_s00136p00041810 [Amborella trichopoda]|uniref:Uncharacterized protein n=1 Tax=Amborella trichopoda TaxID=13333 RepID=W1NEV0_AMBTC|nr:hypothetical protein AMTR_s00136p00041810 [Amborella trichopoda]